MPDSAAPGPKRTEGVQPRGPSGPTPRGASGPTPRGPSGPTAAASGTAIGPTATTGPGATVAGATSPADHGSGATAGPTDPAATAPAAAAATGPAAAASPPTAAPDRWNDLTQRIASAVVLAVVGIADIWVGGIAFDLLVALVVGLIAWELARMCAPTRQTLWRPFAAAAAVALFIALALPTPLALALLAALAVGAALAAGPESDRPRLALYTGWILIAGWGFGALRETGLAEVFWLIGVVIATDVAGYFVGRLVGGPKFWPRVSPKKTWSGTAGGWVAALAVGLAFAPTLGPVAVWLALPLSFASQMGDAAESALKRAKGVKDASRLIPGHGGVFDRFDAMMGAAFVVTLAGLLGFGELI